MIRCATCPARSRDGEGWVQIGTESQCPRCIDGDEGVGDAEEGEQDPQDDDTLDDGHTDHVEDEDGAVALGEDEDEDDDEDDE